MRLWNTKTGEPIHTFSAYSAQQCVAFSPDGNILAIGGLGSIHLWDVETAKRLHILSGYGWTVTGVAFSPDGQTLAGGSDYGVLRLWDVQTGELRPIITEHISSVHGVSFSPDGQTLAIQDRIRNVHLWNARTEALHHTPLISNSMAFSPDGQVLASLSHNTIDLWDLQTEALLHTITKDGISRGVAFSPDSKMIAAMDANGVVLLWDVKTKTLRHTLIAARTSRISFSPNSQTLAGTSRTDVHLWDTKTGNILQEFTGERTIDSISFSPDSQTLAIASRTDVHLWDTKTGDTLQEFTESLIWDMAFSPSGQVLAVGTLTGVRLWDVKTGKILQALQENSAESVAFSPGGKTLACSQSASATLWDTETGELLQALNGHTDYVVSVTFSPQGRTLASLSFDGTVLLWEIIPDPAETDSIATPNDVSDTVDISGYTTTEILPEGAKTRIGKGTLLDMQYTPDGKYLKVTSSIGAWLYDTKTYQEVGMRALPQTINGGRYWSITPHIAISPDGLTSAVEGADRTIYLSDIETNTRLHTITNPITPKQRDDPLSFSPDGKTLVTISDYGLYLWDVETGTLRHTVTERYDSGTNYSQKFSNKLYCFSPDSAILALFTFADIRLWNVETGTLRHSFGNGYNYNHSISFSPDGKTFAAAGVDGDVGNQIRFWDVETGTFLRSIEVDRFFARPSVHAPSDEQVISMAFSPDGKIFAAGHGGGHISLWSTSSGLLLRGIDETTNSIVPSIALRLVFSPDGKTLAGHMEDGTLRLWNVETATHFHTIGYMPLWITSMSFSPDGKTFAIGSGLHTGFISLWDTETGTLLRSFTVGKGTTATTAVVSVAFSPDGNTLATGARDDTLLLWDVKTGNLLRSFPSQVDTHGIKAISFSPDGKTLATGYYKRALLWDIETSAPTCIFGHTDTVDLTAFSPDGKMVATGYAYAYGGINILNAKECTYHSGFNLLSYGRARPKSIAFGPDSKTLRFLNGSGAYLIDLKKNDSSVLLDYKKESEYAAGWHLKTGAFSPDGKTMAIGTQASESDTGNFEGRMHLWNVNTKTRLSTFEDVPVWALAFSPDSTTLASEGGNGTVLLWELAALTEPEPESLTADVNGDGEVNIQDLAAVAAAIGEVGENDADVNGDGEVNIEDLVAVSAAIEEVAAAPAALRQQAAAHLTQEDVQHWLTLAQQANLTDATSVRGIRFLKQLLAAFIPKETALLPNYPNPFNPETWMPYQLATPADVKLTIHDIQGRVVRDLDLGHQRAGMYQNKSRAAYWDGRNQHGEPVASGVYFYTLTAGEFSATRKLLIRK
ncbi:T9SS type A sorting domain-containing protein [Candidatus Poribacteria bacterium]|nr:T9SS type A sorting domain-containing protein [Candidatus Poribacteria bacterium]MYK23817.1 T9SS type A sorting domain-containing protein [Candidatus Poribacteria bacterium]